MGDRVDKHTIVVDLQKIEIHNTIYCGMILDNHGPVKLIESSDRVWLGKPNVPPARLILQSIFPGADRIFVRNVYKISEL